MDYFNGLQIITEPAAEPVSVADVKLQLRLDGTDNDAMLTSMITAARKSVEAILKRFLITTEVRVGFDRLPVVISLPYSPVQSVDAVKYVDDNGDTQTLSSALYRTDLISDPARITPAYSVPWPTTRAVIGAIQVEYTVGYGDAASDVPAPIRQAIISIVIDLFEHPEKSVEMSLQENRTIMMMLNSFRNCSTVM